MTSLSRTLSLQISQRHGVVTDAQLRADGVNLHVRRRLVTDGPARSAVHHGVYRVASSPDTFESRCVAACLADPTAVITGLAAARLWEFHHVRRCDRPVVLVAHDRTPLTRGVLLRRTNRLDPHESVVRPDGIRIASPPRAWFDCARDLDDARFERLTEWVLDQHCQRADAVAPGPVADTTRSTRARPRQPCDEPAIGLAASSRIGTRVACSRCPRTARGRAPRSTVPVAAADGSTDPSGRSRSHGQVGGRGGPRHLARRPVRRAA